jgi:hypothetical protein
MASLLASFYFGSVLQETMEPEQTVLNLGNLIYEYS